MEFYSHLQFAAGIDHIRDKDFTKRRVPGVLTHGRFSITVGFAELDITEEVEVIGATGLQCA